MKATVREALSQTELEAVVESEPEPEAEVEAEVEAIIAFRCPSHATFYPEEDPMRPYTDFKVDPDTRERVHDRACRRCVRARRNGRQDLPAIERVRITLQKVKRDLLRLETTGNSYSAEAKAAQAHIEFLNQRLHDLTHGQNGAGHE
jgi:hypothetical protein